MRFPERLSTFIAVAVVLAMLSACGGGGGGSTTPTPPSIPALSITTSKIPNGVVGKAYSATLQAAGGSGTRTWSIAQGPSWLAINSATGELTGTAPDVYWNTVQVEVRDSSGHSASAALYLVMNSVLQILPPGGGTRGVEYRDMIRTSGGAQPANKLLLTGSLPAGLTIQLDDYGNGTITGTPTEAGSFTFTVEAKDKADPPQDVKADITMLIDTHVAITSKTLKAGVQGRAYTDTPIAINGVLPFTWTANWLPQGLSINSTTGEISGTPASPNYGSPVITVTDSSDPPESAQAYVYIPIFGTLALSFSNPVTTLHAGNLWTAYIATGGVPPLKYSLVGQLPTGLTMSDSSISGQVAQGDYEFAVHVEDSATPPQVAERPFALHVLPPSVSAGGWSDLKGAVATPFSQQVEASGGTPPFTWRSIGSLPPGLALADSGLLSGTPTTEGYYLFNAEVSDSANPVQKSTASISFHALPLTPIPNNSIANATPVLQLGTPASISPYTDENGVAAPDTDYYKFLAQGGSTLTVSTSLWGYSTYVDTVLELLDQNGARLKTCNNPADDNPPSFIVKDPTPNGFDDDCVNDDGTSGDVSSSLTLKVPGNSDTIQTVYAHVLDFRGDARPDMQYTFWVSSVMESLHLHANPVPAAAVNRYFSWGPAASGGLGAHTFSLAGDSSLPPGLSFSAGQISGYPAAAGQYAITFQVRDSANPPQTDQSTFQFTIVPQLTITSTKLPDATNGVAYDAAIAISGGGQSPVFTMTTSSWPCCLYLREDGHIVGTPRETGTYAASVSVRDESGQSVIQSFALTVSDAAAQANSVVSQSTAESPQDSAATSSAPR